jgi:hypothetical protein
MYIELAFGVGDVNEIFIGVSSPIWRLKKIGQNGLFARACWQKNVIRGGAFAPMATEEGWLGSGFASVKQVI